MLHPQLVALLERAAKSPLPPYYEVPAAVARRFYRDTRGPLAPDPPAVESVQLLLAQGPGGPVPMRAYRPKGAGQDEVLPALLYIHGGGWVIGDLDTHDVVCRTLANSARCAVFSVEYRKAPESPFPAAVDDCFAALKFVSREEKKLGINAKQLAVGGDSAGGNLAAVMALMARDAGGPAISFQLLIYPGVDQQMGHPSIDSNGEGYLLTKKSMLYFRGHYLPRKSDVQLHESIKRHVGMKFESIISPRTCRSRIRLFGDEPKNAQRLQIVGEGDGGAAVKRDGGHSVRDLFHAMHGRQRRAARFRGSSRDIPPPPKDRRRPASATSRPCGAACAA